jgi:hypothetical protein
VTTVTDSASCGGYPARAYTSVKLQTLINSALLAYLGLWLLGFCPTATAQSQASGNNAEATSFAKDMTQMTQQTWPKAKAVWHLELTPNEAADDIISYRKKVTYCKGTIMMSEEWLRQTESAQRDFLKSSLDVLHRPPAFSSGKLDYYPNSSGEVTIMVGGRAVAHGSYTPSRTRANRLEPGSFVQDKSDSKYFAQVSVLDHGGKVSFQGSTNLADRESILLTLERRGYSAQTKSIVSGGKFTTETFSARGQPLSPGTYVLQMNIFNPKTGLMVEGKQSLTLFTTQSVKISFKPKRL